MSKKEREDRNEKPSKQFVSIDERIRKDDTDREKNCILYNVQCSLLGERNR